MNLIYDLDLDYGVNASMKSVEWANRKLGSLAERIAEKYPDLFIYENKKPNMYPYAGQLCSKSASSILMTWTSSGLSLWPSACYLPKAKMLTFNNYQFDDFDFEISGILTDGDDAYYIIPENYNDWRKLPFMSHAERILFIEDKLPKFIDKLIKDEMHINNLLKEKAIREAAAKYD